MFADHAFRDFMIGECEIRSARGGDQCAAIELEADRTEYGEEIDGRATLQERLCRREHVVDSVTVECVQVVVEDGHAAEEDREALQIAIATAIQESKLRNIRFGDRDSLGLFQQRPSQGWGTVAQILDPVYATNAFYDALIKIDGYQTMEITKVAQAVQRSGAPEAYADHEQEGRVLASTLTGRSPAGLVCRLRPAQQVVAGREVVADLAAQLGVTAAAGGSQVTLTGPDAEGVWAAGHWAVARAEAYGIDRVQVGDRVWQRGDGDSAKTWSVPATAAAPSAVTIRLATSATG